MLDPQTNLKPPFSFRRWLLDRFCLRPSRHPLDHAPQEKFWIERQQLRLACYRQQQIPPPSLDIPLPKSDDRPLDLLIIKFPGTAGRAELSPLHPANAWPEKFIEVWSINPPGYGESPGRASLDHIPAMSLAVLEEAQQQHPGVRLLVYGNSIGSLAAMQTVALAIERQCSPTIGLMLRNPLDLFPLIMEHRRRWYHGPVPKWLIGSDRDDRPKHGSANHPVANLDSVALARACTCPLLLIQAELDRTVPPKNQDRVFAAHPGPKTKFIIPHADHHQAPAPDNEILYRQYLETIRETYHS